MITYMCNYCKQPINLDEKNCIHFRISFGDRAITSRGVYGDAYDGELCEICYMKLQKSIDVPYYGGGNYLEQERRKTAKDILNELSITPHEYHEMKIKEIAENYGVEVEESV